MDRKKKPNFWFLALKVWNNKRSGMKYLIPKKGTPENAEVRQLADKMKERYLRTGEYPDVGVAPSKGREQKEEKEGKEEKEYKESKEEREANQRLAEEINDLRGLFEKVKDNYSEKMYNKMMRKADNLIERNKRTQNKPTINSILFKFKGKLLKWKTPPPFVSKFPDAIPPIPPSPAVPKKPKEESKEERQHRKIVDEINVLQMVFDKVKDKYDDKMYNQMMKMVNKIDVKNRKTINKPMINNFVNQFKKKLGEQEKKRQHRQIVDGLNDLQVMFDKVKDKYSDKMFDKLMKMANKIEEKNKKTVNEPTIYNFLIHFRAKLLQWKTPPPFVSKFPDAIPPIPPSFAPPYPTTKPPVKSKIPPPVPPKPKKRPPPPTRKPPPRPTDSRQKQFAGLISSVTKTIKKGGIPPPPPPRIPPPPPPLPPIIFPPLPEKPRYKRIEDLKQSIASKKQAIAERDKNLKSIRDRLAVLKKNMQHRKDVEDIISIIKRDMDSDIRNKPFWFVDKTYTELFKNFEKKYGKHARINELKKELKMLHATTKMAEASFKKK